MWSGESREGVLCRNRSVLPGSCCQVMGGSSSSWIQAFLCSASVSSWVVFGQAVLLLAVHPAPGQFCHHLRAAPFVGFGPRRCVSSVHPRLWFCWWLRTAVQQPPRETGTGQLMTSTDVQLHTATRLAETKTTATILISRM